MASVDLSMTYLGLRLANPFIKGASPLADHLDTARRLEDAGCAAIVLHSHSRSRSRRRSRVEFTISIRSIISLRPSCRTFLSRSDTRSGLTSTSHTFDA